MKISILFLLLCFIGGNVFTMQLSSRKRKRQTHVKKQLKRAKNNEVEEISAEDDASKTEEVIDMSDLLGELFSGLGGGNEGNEQYLPVYKLDGIDDKLIEKSNNKKLIEGLKALGNNQVELATKCFKDVLSNKTRKRAKDRAIAHLFLAKIAAMTDNIFIYPVVIHCSLALSEVNNFQPAIRMIRKLGPIIQDNINKKVLAGKELLRDDNYEKAITVFLDALKEIPNTEKTALGNISYYLAASYLEQKQYKNALQYCLAAKGKDLNSFENLLKRIISEMPDEDTKDVPPQMYT